MGNPPLKNLSKGRFLAATRKCPLTAWRLRHREIVAIPEDDHDSMFRAQQGHIIGELATEWFDTYLGSHGLPPGVDIDECLKDEDVTRDDEEEWLRRSIELTQEHLADPNVWAIYEATFHMSGTYTTRADILARVDDIACHGWHDPSSGPYRPCWNMIEVKSIGAGSSKMDEYYDDMAYTTGILRNVGLNVTKIGLMRIDSDFVLEDIHQLDDIDGLLDLLIIDWSVQGTVEQRINSFNVNEVWNRIDALTRDPQRPDHNFSPKCKSCVSCQEEIKKAVGDCQTILNLPYIGKMPERFSCLVNHGIYCIEDVPDHFFVTPRHKLKKATKRLPERCVPKSLNSYELRSAVVTRTTKENKKYINRPRLAGALSTVLTPSGFSGIVWPAMYLDFETVSTAIPLFEGDKPYTAVPTQYSLHSAGFKQVMAPTQPGHQLYAPDLKKIDHRLFIADPAEDERRKMSIKLINDVAQMGPYSSIFIWSDYETRCIKYLANLFPDLADRLLNITRRFVDLLEIVRGKSINKVAQPPNFYHPSFEGSFSIKKVINYFDPGAYDKLDIAGGGAAAAVYGKLSYAHKLPDLSWWDLEEFDQPKIMADLIKYCNIDTEVMISIHSKLINDIIARSPDDLTYSMVFPGANQYMCPDCSKMVEEGQRSSHGMFCKKAARYY